MSKSTLDSIAAFGTREVFHIDEITNNILERIQKMYRMNLGDWYRKDWLVRLAIRSYYQQLKQGSVSKMDHAELLMRAIQGQPLDGQEVY